MEKQKVLFKKCTAVRKNVKMFINNTVNSLGKNGKSLEKFPCYDDVVWIIIFIYTK